MLEKAAKAMAEKKKGLAFTGAGMSTASGIPDFRSPGGVWSRYDIRKLAYLDCFFENPARVWEFFQKRVAEYGKSLPNEGHTALALLESLGVLEGVATQNIDMLHQKGGSKRVFELHGSLGKMNCLECGQEYNMPGRERWKEGLPYCECGALLKPGVVFFGEALNAAVLNAAREMAKKSGFILVAGTSGEVFPAAGIPYEAARKGSLIVEVNDRPTPFTSSLSDFFLEGRVEEVLPELSQKVGEFLT